MKLNTPASPVARVSDHNQPGPTPQHLPGEPKSVRKSERISERTEIRSESTSNDIPLFRSPKRRATRYSFEFYEDQLLRLKQLKFAAEMAGEKATLSDFVREALDEYLKKQMK
ncbi:MAG: hypothetical protein ABI947_22015 [Chloroflexota bacterium]